MNKFEIVIQLTIRLTMVIVWILGTGILSLHGNACFGAYVLKFGLSPQTAAGWLLMNGLAAYLIWLYFRSVRDFDFEDGRDYDRI